MSTSVEPAQSAYDKDDLLRAGRASAFGVGNAQLPAPPMLMMDRVTSIGRGGGQFGKGHVVAELDVTPEQWFFACHFPGDPVMPGCLGLDAMWQIVGFWLGWSGLQGKGRAAGVDEMKFRGQITPATRLIRYDVSLRQVRAGRLPMGLADGLVFADEECVYVAKGLRVALIGTAG